MAQKRRFWTAYPCLSYLLQLPYFRATSITTILENVGTIEKTQVIAAHESPRTTKLYERTDYAITLAEIERIRI